MTKTKKYAIKKEIKKKKACLWWGKSKLTSSYTRPFSSTFVGYSARVFPLWVQWLNTFWLPLEPYGHHEGGCTTAVIFNSLSPHWLKLFLAVT